jgi:hypothetical protein
MILWQLVVFLYNKFKIMNISLLILWILNIFKFMQIIANYYLKYAFKILFNNFLLLICQLLFMIKIKNFGYYI